MRILGCALLLLLTPVAWAEEEPAAKTLAEARVLLRSASETGQLDGVRALQRIGSREALEALLPALEDRAVGAQVQQVFINAADRPLAQAVLESALERPAVPVGRMWLFTRAALERPRDALYDDTPFAGPGLRVHVPLSQAQRREGLAAVSRALPVKRSGAIGPSLMLLVTFQHKSDQIAAAAARAWPTLHRNTKITLLGNEGWPLIRGPLLASVLDETPRAEHPRGWHGDDPRSMALGRLVALGSKAAREEILADMRRPAPRLTHHALLALPDASLPALDTVWIESLENREFGDYDKLLPLIERYATKGLLPSIRGLYDRSPGWACDCQAALLGFLLKHDPKRALADVRAALARRGPKHTGCYRTALESSLPRHWSPAVEALALEYLKDKERDVRVSAAKALIEAGSAAVVERVLTLTASLRLDHPEEGSLRYNLFYAFVQRRAWMGDAAIKAKLLKTLTASDRGVLHLTP